MAVSQVIQNLKKRVDDNVLSHAFLIETNHMEQCIQDVKELVKYLNCPCSYQDNCQEDCNLCHLITQESLPSFVHIFPDGASIKKQQLLDLRDKFSTKPVFSKYNVYLVEGADYMNEAASNAILKFLEEPEDYIVGFFLTTNKENVISTIQSRCQIIKMVYDSDGGTAFEIKGVADAYLEELLSTGDFTATRRLVLPYFNTRNQIEAMFLYYLKLFDLQIQKKYFPGNNSGYILDGLTLQQLLSGMEIIKRMLQFNRYNVNLELILDNFVIEMRRLYE